MTTRPRAGALALLLSLLLLAPVTASCAGAMTAIATAAAVADRALHVIQDVEDHVAPLIPAIDSATAQVVLDKIKVARAAAEQVRERGKAAQAGDYERALDGLEAALADLFKAGAPLGVEQIADGAPPPLLGAQPGGTLGVPTPRAIVRGDG